MQYIDTLCSYVQITKIYKIYLEQILNNINIVFEIFHNINRYHYYYFFFKHECTESLGYETHFGIN